MTVQECLNTNDRHVLAAMCGGQVLELNEPAPADAQLHPLTLAHDEGRRIYERSLRFVLLMALRRLYPGQQVHIEYSAGHGVYVRLPGVELPPARLAEIEQVMRELVQADLPFEKKTWQLDDAIRADEIFSTLMGDKVEPRKEFIEQNSKLVTDLDV